ncbi:MAG: glycosyltransferase family 4 protein [Sedimentisphaerales bacterium]|nr:glycosyltransferase family 4 protein [Sedimentisphaerales bacterium]
MKILMLNYEFPPIGGGGGQAHLALLQQYAGRGDLEVEVLTSAARPGLVVEQFSGNVTIRRVGIPKKDLHLWRRSEVIAWLAKAGSQYRRMLKDKSYDLVHAFFGFPTGWLCYRNRQNPPYVVSLRGSDVPGANARLQLEYKLLGPLVFKPIWRRAAALVACSEGLKSRALKFLPSAEITVIPNGVDLERFFPADPSPSDAAGGPLRLLTVGRLSVTKRLPLLVGVVEHLLKDGERVQLTIVGGGALESELRQLLGEKGLRDGVTLTGRRDGAEMPAIYRQHDVLVSASMQEGMSNAMLEAMASGLPIVTTRCEGVDELIADNGVIVDSSDPADLARAIETLAGASDTRRAMSIAARERAEAFTWRAVAERYIELYKQTQG